MTCLPLPVGEVAERSEDGESKQRPYKKTASPSQSPAVTALPKGEPRLSRNIRCVLHLSCLLTADNSTLTPRKVFSLTHMSRQKSNHTAFFDMPERRRFTSEAAAFLYVSVSLFQTALDVRQVFLAAPGVIGVRVDVYILRFQL